jgi:atypical dual specificity phosphatase
MVWWVAENKLGGCSKPTEDQLNEYKSNGLAGIVSLLDDEENLELYKKHDVSHLWIPVKGGTSPSLEQVHELKSFIDRHLLEGNGFVLVHCTNGNRRTGTMLVAYLILTGRSYEEAKDIALKANPTMDLREAQENFLKELALTQAKEDR